LALILIGIALAALCLAMKHTSTRLILRTETVRHLSGKQLSRAGGGGTITQVDPGTAPTDSLPTTPRRCRSRTAGGASGSPTPIWIVVSTGPPVPVAPDRRTSSSDGQFSVSDVALPPSGRPVRAGPHLSSERSIEMLRE
jgi:hypothetical protein